MSLLLLLKGGGSAVAAPGASVTPLPVRAPLDGHVVIKKPDGREFRWDGHGHVEDIPRGLQCSTKRMEGFSTASVSLARRIDVDYPDLELRDEFEIWSEMGDKIWEGRVSALPRSHGHDEEPSIDVQAVGWMASTRDRKFRQIFADRRFDSWGEPALARKAVVAGLGYGQGKIQTSTDGGISWTPPNELMPINETAEIVYDAGDELTVSKIQYRGARTGTFTNFENAILYTDSASDIPSAASYALTLDNTTREQALTTAEQFLMLRLQTSASTTPAAGLLQKYDQIAVYGDSGIPTHDITGEPDGVYASEVMEWIIQTYCPRLTWAGNDSTYPIPQLAFRDLIHPYDAFLEINKYHLLDLACWEDRKVYWYPIDLSDYDWVAYLDDPGFKVTLEGDSDDGGGFNGIDIQYTDLQTGDTKFLYADDHAELRETDELNPANRHGDKNYTDEALTTPQTEESALQIGRAKLAEANQPKSPGSYTFAGGYVRDRQGNWQPGWKVKATERIILADHPNRRPRLITETGWNQDSHTLTLATDNSVMRIDAITDRIATALVAANLS